MGLSTREMFSRLLHMVLLASAANAHGPWGSGDGSSWGNGDGNSNSCPWWASGCDDSGNDSGGGNGSGSGGNSGQFDPAQLGLSEAQFSTSNRIITVHAVLACLVWVFLIPTGGILLRVGIKSPWILRIHAFLQIFSYVVYVAAIALGIYLVHTFSYGRFSLWSDPHTQLGVAILAIAFFQPILGYVHHKLFKRRAVNVKAGKAGKAPGRTIPGHFHIWIGRLLIVLGVINGGLGLRLASRSPFGGNQRSKIIAYAVASAVMLLLYATIVILFEVRKAKRDRQARQQSANNVPMVAANHPYSQPPTYAQSQNLLPKNARITARYE